jgi:DNA-binding beta-propeller fold protein YncE
MFLVFVGAPLCAAPVRSPVCDYLFYVVCESADKIVRLRFGPEGLKIDHEVRVGLFPTDINGPHGIAMSPDKHFYYISIAHGRPYGSIWKYKTGEDSVVSYTGLGLFPATLDVSNDGNFVYVVNANFHGDMVPSSVSVVATDEMIEAKRIQTCTMPHGSKMNPQGTKHYSVCMMDDMLVEIDAGTFRVSRHFILTKGKEKGAQGAPVVMHTDASCVPTWAQPSIDGSVVYVACNKSSEIVEIDAVSWVLKRRFPAGRGVYNLAQTKDGRLIASNKRGQSISIFDLRTGKEIARMPTKRSVVHGVIVSPDDKYAFLTVEGVGSEPGTVEVVDLGMLRTVATMDVGQQAAGIVFWEMEEVQQ